MIWAKLAKKIRRKRINLKSIITSRGSSKVLKRKNRKLFSFMKSIKRCP